MKQFLKKIILLFDSTLFKYWVKWAYPKYKRPIKGYMHNYEVIMRYFFFQKILRINGNVPWPVDFRSIVRGIEHIQKGICCDPGDNMGIFIDAYGGLKLGNNVNIGQNTIITTTNHYKYDHRKFSHTKGVEIGNNVWIGANCSIVAGSKIGNNVTIGAGCVIRGEVPNNVTVVQAKENIEFIPKTKEYEWDCTKEVLI